MVMQAEPLDRVKPATVPASIEHAISQSLATMRELAAKAGTEDYWENWTREVMDRRLLVFVAAVLDGQTLAWLFEPNGDAKPDYDGVLHTAGYHCRRVDNAVAIDVMTVADWERKTMPVETILHGVSWLVRDLTGEFLEED